MNKILLGFLLGIALSISFSFLYRTYWLRDYIAKPFVIEKSDTSKVSIQQALFQVKNLSGNFDEKFSSVNKRLDDFLVFGGMIITLLLAISVSVYLKTETEVNKHFKEKFGDYSKEANDKVEEIKKYASSAKREFEIIRDLSQSSQQMPPQTNIGSTPQNSPK